RDGHRESPAAGRASTKDLIRVPHPRSQARSSRAGRRTGGHGKRSDKAPQRASHQTHSSARLAACPGATGTQLHPALAELKGRPAAGTVQLASAIPATRLDCERVITRARPLGATPPWRLGPQLWKPWRLSGE